MKVGRSDEDDPLFTREFLLALLINSSFAMVFYMLAVGLAVYAVERFGVGEAGAGFAASAFVLGALIARVFASRYVNSCGLRRSLIASLLIYIVASLLYLSVESYAVLICLRVIHGAGFAFGSQALSIIVFKGVPPARRAEGASYLALAYLVLPAIGPSAALYLISSAGYWAIFSVCALVSAMGLLATLFMKPIEKEDSSQQERGSERSLGLVSNIIETRVLGLACVVFLAGASYSGVLTFLAGFSLEQGAVGAATLYFVAYSVAAVASRVVLAVVQDKWGDNFAVYPALVSFALAMAILAWWPTSTMIVIAGIFAGFGFGSVYPMMQAIIVALVPHSMSRGLSTYFIMMDLGLGVGPVILGLILELTDYEVMYGVATLGVLCTLIAYWFFHGRRQQWI